MQYRESLLTHPPGLSLGSKAMTLLNRWVRDTNTFLFVFVEKVICEGLGTQ